MIDKFFRVCKTIPESHMMFILKFMQQLGMLLCILQIHSLDRNYR